MMVQRTVERRLRGVAALAAAVLVAALLVPQRAFADDDHGDKVLFTQQDAVQAFDLGTGHGYQIGTAMGSISGTTFVDFQFAPTGPPNGDTLPISFHNKVIITDID